MIIERIPLDPANDEVFLDAYVAEPCADYRRKALLICPGGAYGMLDIFREGEAVAQAFMPHGYNAFVLSYSLKKSGKTFPAQLIEASLAVKHIRENAKKYGIDPNMIFVAGFSSGGHLAACLATMWKRPDVCAAVGGKFGCNRPAGIMLLYPVISADCDVAPHMGSFRNLLGLEEPSHEQLAEVCVEKNVDADACPVFMMHTADDEIVGVRNSLVLADAYSRLGIPFELHIYTGAPHGVALANKVTEENEPRFVNSRIAAWVDQAAAWAESLCVL